ncbi:MAG: sulfite exporter TauE/SafE family protein [Pirellulales bacterium]|nr:sulfite exporter TauE/SafE family protein [Pirellulales bacterium]
MENLALLAVLFFLAATLYASVGHAGASAYLAIMGLLSVPADVMKPTALFLNVVVGTITTARFAKAGCFSWRRFWPFAVTSIPCSYLGGKLHLTDRSYKVAVGAILLFAAYRLAKSALKKLEDPVAAPPLAPALVAGAGIGLLSGLTGTGGGIFLSPLLILTGWADVRSCAGVSAAFVLVNSIAGLAGNLFAFNHLPSSVGYLALAAAAGGMLGAELGSRRLTPSIMRYFLAAVLVIAGSKLILFKDASRQQVVPMKPPAFEPSASDGR